MYNFIITVYFTLLMILLFIFYRKLITYKKQMLLKNDQVSELTKNLQSLEAKMKQKERRRSYRAKVENVTCEFQFNKIGGKDIGPSIDHKGLGFVIDISSTGMKFMCEYDIAVRKNVELFIKMQLDDKEFNLVGKLIRKEEYMNSRNIIYALHFISMYSKDQGALQKVIRDMELQERRRQLLS